MPIVLESFSREIHWIRSSPTLKKHFAWWSLNYIFRPSIRAPHTCHKNRLAITAMNRRFLCNSNLWCGLHWSWLESRAFPTFYDSMLIWLLYWRQLTVAGCLLFWFARPIRQQIEILVVGIRCQRARKNGHEENYHNSRFIRVCLWR